VEKYEGFRVKGYFGLHNTILRIFWSKLISLEITNKLMSLEILPRNA